MEKGIEQQIDFFHLNRVSSSMVIKVDFDLVMSIFAHNMYRLLAFSLDRYHHFLDERIYEKFVDNSGEIEIGEKDRYSTHTAYGTIKDVTFRNIKYSTHSNTRVCMNAMLEENLGRIEHIYFDNIIINGAKATSLYDLNLQLIHVDDDKIFLY